MNRKYGLMNNSPGGGKVENGTAKFGQSVTLQPKPDQSVKVSQPAQEQPQFLNKYNLKKIPDNSMADDEFSLYDQYDAPEIQSNE